MRPNTIHDVLLRLVIHEPSTLPTGCWLWPGRKCAGGYGQLSMSMKLTMVHIAVYEHFCGAVPKGLELDHLCRNRLCANFEHLEAVSHDVNCRRGPQFGMRITHCKNGHEMTADNVLPNPKGYHICRICRELYLKEYRARHRGENTLPMPQFRTHCPSGHPYAGENLVIAKNGGRICRECRRQWKKDFRARKKAPQDP
jgi:hypothetical protein